MLCPYCGKENANAFGRCNSCGNPMVPVAGVSPGIAPAPGFSPSKRMSPLGWAAIILMAGLGSFVAATWPVPSGEHDTEAYKIGIFIGLMLPPLIVAYLAGGIKKWRSPNRFAVVFFLVGMIWTSLGWLGSQEKPEARIARLMREASGRQPIKKAFRASDREFDNLVREQFGKLIQLNREYAELESKISAVTDKVGTPESFVDPTYAAEGVRQLHEMYLFDQQLAQKLTEIGVKIRHAVDVTDWSARTKTRFLKGFETSFAESMERCRGLVDAEQAFVEATDNLYDYSNAHYSEFRIEDGHLKTTNVSLLAEFNSRMEIYNARGSEFLRVREGFKRYQSATLSKFGMTPKDLGLR